MNDKVSLTTFSEQLKRLWFQLEIRGEDGIEQRDGLLRLLRLLLDNIGELLTEDQWLRGQIVAVREIIAGPLSVRVLDEAKASLKTMIATLIDRMGDLSDATGEYHGKIKGYSEKITQTDNIALLGNIMDDILRETRVIQASTLSSREDLQKAKLDAEAADTKIRQLEAELTQVGGLIRVDPLTGSLNRRGLDDYFVREIARSDRQHTPLSVALIDIDNFKQLNDRLVFAPIEY